MDVQFIPSSFGGGWLVPRTLAGVEGCYATLADDAGYCDPVFIAPVGEEGYIVEPYEAEDLVTTLRGYGLEVTL